MSVNRERLNALARLHLAVVEAQHTLDLANQAQRDAEQHTYLQQDEGPRTVIVPQGDRDLAVTMARGSGGAWDYRVSEVVND